MKPFTLVLFSWVFLVATSAHADFLRIRIGDQPRWEDRREGRERWEDRHERWEEVRFEDRRYDWRYGLRSDHSIRVFVGVSFNFYHDRYRPDWFRDYPVFYDDREGALMYRYGDGARILVEPVVMHEIMYRYGVSYEQIMVVPTEDPACAAIFVETRDGPVYVMHYSVRF